MSLPRFTLSDDQLNGNGFRIITKGINLSRFLKNPIMLWMHERWDPKVLPIGKWTEIKKDETSLTADPYLDASDEFAKSINAKIEQGIINACSIGIEIIETSIDPKVMLPGQTRPTITKCMLIEVSLVAIPANHNSVRLYREGSLVELSIDKDNSVLPFLNSHNSNPNSMKTIALKLNLHEDATEQQILSAIGDLQSRNLAATQRITTLEDLQKAQTKKLALQIVNEALAAGKFTDDKKEAIIAQAEANPEATRMMLSLIPGITKPTDDIIPGGKLQEGQPKTWDELLALGKSAVDELKLSDKARYTVLFKAKYKREPSF